MSHRGGSISPPPTKKRRTIVPVEEEHESRSPEHGAYEQAKKTCFGHGSQSTHIQSPMRLNFMPEFPASSVRDTVRLGDILGNPLIRECWLFNYLFDVDFVL